MYYTTGCFKSQLWDKNLKYKAQNSEFLNCSFELCTLRFELVKYHHEIKRQTVART